MAGNGKVFISHTRDDSARCNDLIAALDAWGVDYWFDAGQTDVAPQLSPDVQKAIAERDVFIRICTANTARSMGMNMEAGVFRVAQAGMSPRRREERRFINLILDPLYQPEPFDNATLFLDAATRPRAVWVSELGRALGLDPTARTLNRRTFIGLGAAVAVTVASAATAGITLARDQGPGTSKPKVTLDVSRTPFGPRWQTRVRQSNAPGIAVSGNTLVAVGDIEMPTVALNATTGRQLWTSTRATTISGGISPAIAGNTVVIGGEDATVYALDLQSGKELWTAQVGNLYLQAIPAVADGTVYITGDDGSLYALDASSGNPAWSKPFSPRSTNSESVLSAPLVAGGVVYVGSLDGNLYAFDAKFGSVKWKAPTRGPIFSSPAAADSRVYVGSTDGYVYAFQAADGKQVWRFRTGGGVTASPALLDGVLYVGSQDLNLYALDAATGGFYWSALVGDATTAIVPGVASKPQHAGNGPNGLAAVSRAARAVYVYAAGALYGFNVRDGSRRGRFQTGGDEFTLGSSPAVVDAAGLAFVGAADGQVYAVNL